MTIRLLLVFVVTMALGALVFYPAQAQDQDAQALFSKRCSKCHGLDRTNRNETANKWREIVHEMKNKWFSGISDQEAEIIAEYLIETKGAN